MNKIVVLTSITGGKDKLIENQKTRGAKFVAFTDDQEKSKTWEIRPAVNIYKDRRRNCKPPKLQPHLYVDAEVSIWIDANVRLKVSPAKLIKEWLLPEDDIIVFFHSTRDCLYKEAEVEAALGKAEPSVIKAELEQYRKEGYPEHYGLVETNMIIRRHNDKVRDFNNLWAGQVNRYAQRDQKTFCYTAWKTGLPIKYLSENIREHPYFDYVSHLDGRAYL